jgi:hypothetical protein
MFMRFRGGGIGHKMTRDWDEFLQRDGVPSKEDVVANEDIEDVEVEGGEGDHDMGFEDSDGESDEQEREDSDDDTDKVVADSDEELDDDILAQEGYGAL